MAYSLLDDGFHSNPKIVAAGLPAAGLFARALSYCSDYLTDGDVPVQWVEDAAGRKHRAAIAALETRGLFVRRNDVFHIPKYLEYNPPRSVVEARRAEKAKSGRKGATKRWAHGTSNSEAIAEPIGDPSENAWQSDSEPIARAQEPTNTNTNGEQALGTSQRSSSSDNEEARPGQRDFLLPPRNPRENALAPLGDVADAALFASGQIRYPDDH